MTNRMAKGAAIAALCAAAAGTTEAAYTYTVTTNEEKAVTVAYASAETTMDRLTVAFKAPDVESVTYNMRNDSSVNVIVVGPDEPATYTGGTTLIGTQVRPVRNDVFGSGPITMKSGSMFVGTANGLDFANKLIFSSSPLWAFATDSNNLILHNIGSDMKTPTVGFGREKNAGRITLKLDGADNDPIAQANLRGKLTLTFDGGTLRLGERASDTFFVDTDPEYAKTVEVTQAGFTVDAAKGANVELGMPFAVSGVTRTTNVVETIDFTNGSFEESAVGGTDNGKKGWAWERVENQKTALVGVVKNGSSNCTTWLGAGETTPYGDMFLCNRCGHTLKSIAALNVPAEKAGEWWVSFAHATRPDNNGYLIDTYITLSNDTAKTEQTIVLKHGKAAHGFKDALVGPFDLAAGDHYLRVANSWNSAVDKNAYGGKDYDNFKLTRLSVTASGTPLAKTGDGKVTFAGVTGEDAAFDVRGGVLGVTDSALARGRLDVAEGAALELGAATLAEGTKVSVAAGGTLGLSDVKAVNLIANGSFEKHVSEPSSKDLSRDCPPSDWTFSVVTPHPNNRNGSDPGGSQGYGGNVSEKGPTLDGYGLWSAAVREKCRVSTTFEAAEDGAYRLEFQCAQRKGYADADMVVTMQIDGQTVVTAKPTTAEFALVRKTVGLTAGEHTLAFDVDGSWTGDSGPMAFLDGVRVDRVGAALSIEDATVEMARGSALRLDNEKPIYVKDLFVDGVKVNGGRKALGKAGVTVVGDGAITVGEPLGLLFLIR